jgi:hypothetical protein
VKPILLLGLLLALPANAGDELDHWTVRATFQHHGAALLPDPFYTPGAIAFHDAAAVCRVKWGKDARHVTPAMKLAVYRAYGLSMTTGVCRAHQHGRRLEHCEVDHKISRELGGADDVTNLWPQPYHPGPGAHEKDQVENWLHREVCAGRMTLDQAQRAINDDWYAVYLTMKGQR